ncbi:hypothetical protein GCM10007301_10090 [Azorhizobium oxalatiphilum]|uniref:Uncharacterized protein n=1 Tax=Azorhizobium oxalatiphilum TaxID=980631 RepID=A0A917BPP1_9HYPH|nr:hypothetical protein [Azorhizobium oxalatiphilum]GGF52587.1 hypothetical protein GCM10007301_10090 [Azorhizobium oxalatiphilum]
MRVAPLFVLAAAAMVAVTAFAPSANAQSDGPVLSGPRKPVLAQKKTRIEIVKRSPLDAGTVVKPGSKSYLDYALPANVLYPTNGPSSDHYGVVPVSAALPGRWDLPGF